VIVVNSVSCRRASRRYTNGVASTPVEPRPQAVNRLTGRLVVISPHLDDAILSLGATIAHAVESGAKVEILTVFAYEPGSAAPTDDWDRKSGFATEGEASQQRRIEDRAACSILGVAPRWFDFSASPYRRRASMAEVVATVVAATAGVDTILIPDFRSSMPITPHSPTPCCRTD